MLRTVFARLLAVLITALLLATGLQAPAEALTSRTLSLAASPAAGLVKSAVTFSGKVSRSPKGTPVTIQRKVGTRWVAVKSTRTTTKTGNYRVVVTRPAKAGNYVFRAVSPKTRRLKAAVSVSRTIKVQNKVTTTLTATPLKLPAGQKTTFTGTVKPWVTNSLVSIQKLLNGKWTNVITAPVQSDGTFEVEQSVGPITQFRAASPLVGFNAVGYSPTVTVTTTPVIATSTLPTGTRTLPYSAKLITVDQSKGVWTASNLPDGLVLNKDTGAITGTPTELVNSTVDLTFTKTSTGEVAPPKSVSIMINEHPLPVITTSSLPPATQVSPYKTSSGGTVTLAAQGKPAGTWSVSNLPAGLTVNPSTGAITGASQEPNSRSVTLRFTQTSTGLAAQPRQMTLSITPAGAPTITTSSLPDGMRTLAYPKTSNSGTGSGVTLVATGPPNGEKVVGTWSTNTSLPAGLSLNTSTGVITGTPTGTGTKTIQFTFTQQFTGKTATRSLALEVLQVPAPNITTTALTGGTVNTAYSGVTPAVTTVGATAGDWSATNLPNGLSINSTTGQITGTPTESGTFAVALRFTQDSSGFADTVNLNLVVLPAITTSSLPNGTRTEAYPTTQVTAVGNPTGTWSATNLPAGLSISSAGVISGTVAASTAPGTRQVTLRFTQTGTGQTQVTRNVSLTILQADGPTITTSSLATGTAGTPYETPDLTATGPGDASGTWTAAPLPAGLSLNATTGAITGTPTGAGTTQVVIEFTQTSTGLTASKTLALAVKPVISTTTLPTGTVGSEYSFTLNGTGTGTWSASPLPAGLSLNTSTGEISGTPTEAGTTAVTIGYAVGGVAATGKTLDLDVRPVITTTALPDGTVGSTYEVTLVAAGGSGTWSASPLPAGLSLNASTGEISGTPTAAGVTNVVIGFSREGVAATGRTIALEVRPAITTTSLPQATRTEPYSFTLQGTESGTWSASPLPAGLSLNTSTGEISGTPTESGSTNVVIGYTVNGITAVGKTLSLVVVEPDAPVISTNTLPDGQVGSPYSKEVQAQGNPAGEWEIVGTAPDGLTINSTDGTISGTPTVEGDYVVMVRFTQTSTGLSTSKSFDLRINPA